MAVSKISFLLSWRYKLLPKNRVLQAGLRGSAEDEKQQEEEEEDLGIRDLD